MVRQLARAQDDTEDECTEDREQGSQQRAGEALEQDVDDPRGDERLPEVAGELALLPQLPHDESCQREQECAGDDCVQAMTAKSLRTGGVEEDGGWHQAILHRRSSIAAPNEIISTMTM